MDGRALRAWRRAHRLTQAQLAAHLDTTENTVSRWEMGEIAIRQAGMLALALEALDCRLAGVRANEPIDEPMVDG